MSKRPSEHFCLAPWTHTFLSPQGERRLCCASREAHQFVNQYLDSSNSSDHTGTFSPTSLVEHWNSDFLKDVRKRMLKGEVLPECSVCDNKELSLNTYREYFTTELFPHLIEEAIESTDIEGATTMRPRSFDYRFNNTCNFKCRMCGEQLSSTWEIEKKNSKLHNPKDDFWMEPEIKDKMTHFQENVAYPEFKEALLRGEVEEIYWVGGEPLVWDYHWEIMQMLVDKKLSQNIFIRYNTNLSIVERDGVNLFNDLLPHFKDYMILASIDAAGKVGEYVRTGLNWERWLENFKQGIEKMSQNGERSMIMDVTLTLPGLFGLVDLVKTSHQLGTPVETKLVYAFGPDIMLSPLALPREILEPFLNKLIKQIFPYLTNKNRSVLNALMDLKKRPTFEESYPEDFKEGYKRGKERLQYLEEIRGDRFTLEDIYASEPAILSWWRGDIEE